jgi:hypothetical protein
MKKRSSFIGYGIFLILIGILQVISGEGDFMGNPVPGFVGYPVAALGLMFIHYGVSTKKIPQADYNNFAICSECQASFYAKDVHHNRCPECNGTVEDLDGFYQRHPELKDEDK